MAKTDLYLYLISHDRKDIKTHTYIGCVEDFTKRLNQHNGLVAGGPRVTRKAAGNWEPVLILKLMKNSDHDSKKIKKEWKQSSRGLESRIRKGFALAIKYNLNVLVMKNRKGKVPVLNILEDKWENDKVVADKTIWDKLLNGE
tara:strand:- start:1521 stop:1949 length:429 start_codon:yes stop_codon:yes gene_type:complete